MKKSCFMTVLCASLVCMGLFSCEKDEVITEVPEPTPEKPAPEPEPAHYVDIAYTLNCSEDLLKYVIPQVTYMGDFIECQYHDMDQKASLGRVPSR